MNKRRQKRKARMARRQWRLEHPGELLAMMGDVLKAAYPQKRYITIAYHGARRLGGRFKRRYGGPEYRARQWEPHPFVALMEKFK
jgi:hypothetical protein